MSSPEGNNPLKLFKGAISKVWVKLRGVKKDPFCCLGLVAVILFGILVFTPSFGGRHFSFLDEVSGILDKNPPKNPIAGLIKLQPESPDLSLIQENSLLAISSSVFVFPQVLGQVMGETGEVESELRKEIIEYIVQPGDSLLSISENFGISLNTLLWANALDKNSVIKPDQKLIILPVSGVIHHVKKGDTLYDIAKIYKGQVADIIAFNELSAEGDIYIGDILIIPDGVMPPPPKIPTSTLVPLASSYFICPISSPCKISQGLHWYNAIDLTHGRCGEPILAAAGGTILRVKYGWNKGAGNYLTILHPNGVVTMYGHLQSILVAPGDNVSQGQIIALMGGQPGTAGAGSSTGCHLHFGVQGANNPFSR